MKLAAVVLAAGKSERMGRNKLLLEVAGRTILDRLLDALGASSIDEVFVVLGHRAEDLRPLVEAHGVKTVFNPDYERGMTSSFKTGLHHVSADAVFLVLGDQLGLDGRFLNRMTARMESDPDALIISPVHKGRRGHPVLFRQTLFPEILNLAPEETVRDIILHHETAHRLVEASVWYVLDIDTPEDFEKAKRLFEAIRGVES